MAATGVAPVLRRIVVFVVDPLVAVVLVATLGFVAVFAVVFVVAFVTALVVWDLAVGALVALVLARTARGSGCGNAATSSGVNKRGNEPSAGSLASVRQPG